MKRSRLLFPLLAGTLLAAGPTRAEGWTVKLKAQNGRSTYSHEQPMASKTQENFAGKPHVRGGGPELGLIFNAYLHPAEDGLFKLDYQVELGGDKRALPPFQASGKVRLPPGKPVLAVESGGWKVILELDGESEGEYPRNWQRTIDAALKCGRLSYQAKFSYVPQDQYSVVLYAEKDDAVRKFMLGLLPNSPGLDGEFKLQYTLLLKEGRETLAGGDGELILAPGGGRRSAAAGKNCVFSAKASR